MTSLLKIKIGDLVKWDSVPQEFSEVYSAFGVVLQISKTGHQTTSAKILFTDGSTDWINTDRLEIMNESRRSGKV